MALKDHTSAGSAAGFLFQLEQALALLSTSKRGVKVGLETLDDISALDKDDETILGQAKHTTSGYKPIIDTGADLWKTLAIWAAAIKSSELTLKSTSFYLVTNRKIDETSLLRKIANATSVRQAKDAISRMKTLKLKGKAKKSFATVFELPDVVLVEFIRRVKVFDDAPALTSTTGLDALQSDLHIPDNYDAQAIVERLLGWIHGFVMSEWRAGRPAWISVEAFNTCYHHILQKANNVPFEVRARHLLPISSEDRRRANNPTRLFLRQLCLILEGDRLNEICLEAVDDYICNLSERSRLASEGQLLKDDFKQFDESLIDGWRNIFRRHAISIGSYDTPELCGYDTMLSCFERNERLAQRETPAFFVRGSYHSLADEKQVGWHPQFSKKLK